MKGRKDLMYAKTLAEAVNSTPQTSPVLGRDQIRNSAGGYCFEISPRSFLDRFLILGTEGGTYYAGEKAATLKASKQVLDLIKTDGQYVVSHTTEVSQAGRAPKNDPAVFVLALCAAYGDTETKKATYQAIPQVCRIGTHIFQFCDAVNSLRGWSAGLRNGVAQFYLGKSEDQVALQLIKYRQRGGWSHKDVLRLSHAHSQDLHNMFRWAVGKELEGPQHPLIAAFERVQASEDLDEIIQVASEHHLPWEALPTQALAHAKVWKALVAHCPLGALVRNLGRLSSLGLTTPMSEVNHRIISALSNQEEIRRARLHPLSILVASRVYAQGHGDKGSLSWKPTREILDVLDEAFHLSFGTVEPINQRVMSCLDLSGSMTWNNIAGLPITPRVASAAMAMVRQRLEPQSHLMGFTQHLSPLSDVSKKDALDTVINKIESKGAGGTDCSMPMKYAMANNIPVDLFECYTDNETYGGSPHPFQALKQYREKSGINAKLVVYGMTATNFSIADPRDPGMLDMVGFDTAAPQAVTAWARS